MPARAQTVEEFYRGKTIQFMVGYPPSGAFDAYTRVAARFIGKHIPGNPTVIVNNMPGASSLQFVRYLQSVAPKDGSQFGMFNRGLMPKSVLEPKETGVDFTKFTWIGSMNSELAICYMWGAKGIKTVKDKHNLGTIDVRTVLEKSSNVGALKIAQKMAPQEMWNTYTALGYGQKPQIQFPGAVPGRLRPWKTWRPVEQATMSYGYGLSASLLQMARAYTPLARDGDVIPLTMLKRADEEAPVAGLRVTEGRAHEAMVAAEKRVLEAFPAADIIIHPDPHGRAEAHGGTFGETEHGTR